MTDVVVSGIRATGRMHLGNYLGVLERAAAFSRDPTKRCFFFIADLHTLTTFREAALIRQHAPRIVLDMLAAGVDPERAVLYAQSDVPVVTELAWYLACLTPHGDLGRMPTFKDKAAKHADDVNAGLYLYPVLMAADILGPRATQVPVGEDQQPHLELAAAIARRFNRLHGEFFPVPSGLREESITVPGLVAMRCEQGPDGERITFTKMGKSEDSGATLYLDDDADAMWAKLRVAPTDPARERRTDPGTPERCAIFGLHNLLDTDAQLLAVQHGCRTAGIGCADCKRQLTDTLTERLREFRERRAALVGDATCIREILHEGARVARTLFTETTNEVAERMGVFRGTYIGKE